jgi:cytochrome c
MSLVRISLVLGASALVLAACGGGGQPPASPPPAAETAPPPAAPADAAPATDAAAPADAAVPADAAAAPADAAAPAAEPAAAAAGGDLASLIAAADVNKGKTLFLQCRACHSLNPQSEPGKIGPTLYKVVGRAAGAVEGFAYSDAVKNSGKTWTVEEIDHWLEKPSEYLPGNKMVFIGLKKPEDRANVIAYIQQESAK